MKHTCKAGWREIGGKRNYYRSRWEANYARFLQWQKDRGQVTEWLHEPETFWFDGIRRGCTSYKPDFRVTLPNGAIEYHEVKGWMDPKSKTKLKRMAKYHPHVKMVVVDKPQYRSINGMFSGAIDQWER